jgi:Rrf2 family protein
MILVPQKSQYALRAIFELSMRFGRGPVKIADIARAQAIPVRFLEVILSQLKQGGFVESQRGSEGGYYLLRDPHEFTVGELLRFLQWPIAPVGCLIEDTKVKCQLYGDCVFMPMWERVRQAISDVFDNETFQDLVEKEHERKRSANYVASYMI